MSGSGRGSTRSPRPERRPSSSASRPPPRGSCRSSGRWPRWCTSKGQATSAALPGTAARSITAPAFPPSSWSRVWPSLTSSRRCLTTPDSRPSGEQWWPSIAHEGCTTKAAHRRRGARSCSRGTRNFSLGARGRAASAVTCADSGSETLSNRSAGQRCISPACPRHCSSDRSLTNAAKRELSISFSRRRQQSRIPLGQLPEQILPEKKRRENGFRTRVHGFVRRNWRDTYDTYPLPSARPARECADRERDQLGW